MMVLRHLSATTAAVPCRNENKGEEEKPSAIPMDLSSKNTKVGRGAVSPMEPLPLNLNKSPFTAVSTSTRPLSLSSRSSSENIINNNTITLNNNEIGAKSHNIYKSDSPVNFSTRKSPSSQQPPNQIGSVVSLSHVNIAQQQQQQHTHHHHHHNHHHHHHRRGRKAEHRWRESSVAHGADDDDSTFSSPDSGLHRDSPGEDDEVSSTKPLSPSLWRSPPSASASSNAAAAAFLRKQSHPCLIPLSLIRGKYNNQPNSVSPDRYSSWEDEHHHSEKRSEKGDHQVQTKRARLEEMVSQIKTTKDRTRHYSGDDDTSSGDHVTSSDEVVDDGPTDLRNKFRGREKALIRGRKDDSDKGALNLIKDEDYDMDEPCNLTYPKSSSPRPDGVDIERWKKQAQLKSTSPFPLSPTDAAKLYGIDPDTYQQQIMQLQLTSAAMMGDPSGLLKALGSYPPWVYMGYYSQLLQSFQAQEILRQYAMQSSSSPQPTSAQVEKAPTPSRTTSSTNNYRSQSPLSPASVNEGGAGMDSDGSVVGQTTPSSANGKRAPRAMTGRHVRTGTGASPSTLLTLRQKIEERQRVKAQQARQEALLNSQGKGSKGSSKYSRKPAKK